MGRRIHPVENWQAMIFGEEFRVLLAGALGGVIRWMKLGSPWRSGLTDVFVGAVCAYYLNPLAEPIVDGALGHFVINPAARLGFSGFLIGLGGIGIVGFAMDLIKSGIRRKTSEMEK